MRLNKFIASHSSLSRRAADALIDDGRVQVNGKVAESGQQVSNADTVSINGRKLEVQNIETKTIIFHKPTGYVCSRDGQGSKTVYDLLPEQYQRLNTVGRLDKDSSGLLVLTNDGELANNLTHPRYVKTKVYEVTLNKDIEPLHQQMISDYGIQLSDGVSKLLLTKINDDPRRLQVVMHEGRNRQIRRTFIALGYSVNKLHRISFGEYQLGDLEEGEVRDA